MQAQIVGWVPQCPPRLVEHFINKAWDDVRRARLWSFLQAECGIFCPEQVTAGTVSFTQFGTTVTCNATASAALLAISLPSPLTLANLQIRLAASGSTSQVYNIESYDDSTPTAVVLTLDRIIMAETDATSGYQVYRCYIRPTSLDFLAWQSVVDMNNGYNVQLDRTSTAFDVWDPQRMSQGMAYYLGSYKGTDAPTTYPLYELWPHPVSGQTFYARYRRRGVALEDPDDELPPGIDEDLVVTKALGDWVFPWAATQVGQNEDFRGVNYPTLMLNAKKQYRDGLLDAKRNDDEQQLQTVWARGHGLIHTSRGGPWGTVPFPIDAKFIQGHLLNI